MYLGVRAGVGQIPHFTPPVAERAHDRVRVADLLSVTQQRVERRTGGHTHTAGSQGGRSHERRAVEESQAIKEDYDPDNGGRDEEISVPAQPQVVQRHLLPKVVPVMRKRGKVTRSQTVLHNIIIAHPIRSQRWTACHTAALHVRV